MKSSEREFTKVTIVSEEHTIFRRGELQNDQIGGAWRSNADRRNIVAVHFQSAFNFGRHALIAKYPQDDDLRREIDKLLCLKRSSCNRKHCG